MNVKKNERVYASVDSFKELIEVFETRGDKVAFKYPVKKAFETISYADFAAEIKAIAAGLDRVGLAGKRIAVIGETSHQWVASYFATVATGGAIIPMDKEITQSQIEQFIASVDAEAVIYDKLLAMMIAMPMVNPFTTASGT